MSRYQRSASALNAGGRWAGPTGAGWTLYPPQAVLSNTPGGQDWGIILMLVSLAFFILGFFGREVYRQAPPIPLEVRTPAGLVVMTRDGVPVYVRDIARVVDTTEDRRSVLRVNGRPAVRMRVTKQSGGNTVEVARNVRAEMERISRSFDDIAAYQIEVRDLFRYAFVDRHLVVLVYADEPCVVERISKCEVADSGD